jgi:HK97 family phage portal protein
VMGVPPFMIGHTEKTTSWGTGIEQMSIGFVKYTLQRHLVAIEQELNHKLFKTSRNFAEFVTAGLERGDIKTRFESYRIALGRAGEQPWMDADEVRRLENLPPNPNLKTNPGATDGQPTP